MAEHGPRSKRPCHSTSLYHLTTHSSTATPLMMGSVLHDTSQLLNARSAPAPTSALRPLYMPAEQMALLYPQGDQASFFGANAHAGLTTVPTSLAFGPNHIQQAHSQNVLELSAAAPIPPSCPSMNNAQPMNGNGYFQSPLSQPTSTPLQITAPRQPVGIYEFIGENPANLEARHKRRPRTEAHEQAVKSTIGAGGACVWCQAKKKGCGSEIPCKACTQQNKICIRGSSSICLTSTTKINAGRQLNPDSFQKARDIMTQLKNNWALYPQHYHKTWSAEAAKLDLHRLDAAVQTSLVSLALSFVAVPGVESSEFSDPLNKNALKVAKLFAAIYQLSKSDVSVQSMAVGVGRMTVFFLMTIYAMEMCNASVHFADELYAAIRNKKSEGRVEQHAIRVYSQVIKKMMTLQHTESLISAIFEPIQPRLENLRDTVQKLLLSPMSKRVMPDFSGLRPFHIAIGLTPAVTGTTPTASSRQEMRHEQLRYSVENLLREDFDLGMNNGFGIPETIDPHLLSPAMATQTTTPSYETSTNLYSAGSFTDIFSSAVGGFQSTDITYPHRVGTALYPSQFDGYAANSSYPGGAFGRANDFANIGTHFSH
ncbi:hypothetical protein UA08_04747 [Talaromyces atroroseus]|uniref:Zn(2)-C6 fungal-type domain-containing protein n=1 Tax=Talaromyces atroroseus TaxID=1441469 RepID=A0A225AKU2_TALAT|nr:hypothetical protein UA08_04747 [Talaromyces atroroseus]OKL60023.1 hypothetical protein UA08_04747 [Talaromyces atroroseus]